MLMKANASSKEANSYVRKSSVRCLPGEFGKSLVTHFHSGTEILNQKKMTVSRWHTYMRTKTKRRSIGRLYDCDKVFWCLDYVEPAAGIEPATF